MAFALYQYEESGEQVAGRSIAHAYGAPAHRMSLKKGWPGMRGRLASVLRFDRACTSGHFGPVSRAEVLLSFSIMR